MIKLEECTEDYFTCQSCGNKNNLKWIRMSTNANSSISMRLCQNCLEELFNQLNYKEYYSISELSKLLNMHENTLLKHIKQGKLKTYKAGVQHRVSRKQLKKYLEGTNEC